MNSENNLPWLKKYNKKHNSKKKQDNKTDLVGLSKRNISHKKCTTNHTQKISNLRRKNKTEKINGGGSNMNGKTFYIGVKVTNENDKLKYNLKNILLPRYSTNQNDTNRTFEILYGGNNKKINYGEQVISLVGIEDKKDCSKCLEQFKEQMNSEGQKLSPSGPTLASPAALPVTPLFVSQQPSTFPSIKTTVNESTILPKPESTPVDANNKETRNSSFSNFGNSHPNLLKNVKEITNNIMGKLKENETTKKMSKINNYNEHLETVYNNALKLMDEKGSEDDKDKKPEEKPGEKEEEKVGEEVKKGEGEDKDEGEEVGEEVVVNEESIDEEENKEKAQAGGDEEAAAPEEPETATQDAEGAEATTPGTGEGGNLKKLYEEYVKLNAQYKNIDDSKEKMDDTALDSLLEKQKELFDECKKIIEEKCAATSKGDATGDETGAKTGTSAKTSAETGGDGEEEPAPAAASQAPAKEENQDTASATEEPKEPAIEENQDTAEKPPSKEAKKEYCTIPEIKDDISNEVLNNYVSDLLTKNVSDIPGINSDMKNKINDIINKLTSFLTSLPIDYTILIGVIEKQDIPKDVNKESFENMKSKIKGFVDKNIQVIIGQIKSVFDSLKTELVNPMNYYRLMTGKYEKIIEKLMVKGDEIINTILSDSNKSELNGIITEFNGLFKITGTSTSIPITNIAKNFNIAEIVDVKKIIDEIKNKFPMLSKFIPFDNIKI